MRIAKVDITAQVDGRVQQRGVYLAKGAVFIAARGTPKTMD
jgi:hypothetical protein